jgi:hypothetical protein
MDHALMLYSSKGPRQDRHVECSFVKWQPNGRRLDKQGLIGQIRWAFDVGDAQSVAVDVNSNHPVRRGGIAPRESAIAASDLEDAFALEVTDSQQVRGLFFLGVFVDWHPNLLRWQRSGEFD